MKAQEIVKKAFADIENGTIDASIYTDDMVFKGPVPVPMNRDAYIGLLKNITTGLPDFNFHARDFTVRGDVVKVTIGITGTQTKTLPALMPGMSDVPATNKRIVLPEEHLSVKVRGDKISECVADAVPGGGVMGMLAQLGVQMKKAA